MYARDLPDGRVITLGVSGKLWNRSLVMYDPETKSLWSHILGKAMQGPLQGMELELIPSVMTDWAGWKEKHPETTVATLSRTSRNYIDRFHSARNRFVVGMASGGEARAWPFDVLANDPVRNETWQGRPIVVTFEPDAGTARVFDRRVGDQVLTFKRGRGDTVTDEQTGSVWDRMSGQAIQGSYAGQALEALPAITSYKTKWFEFHPNSETAGR